MPIKAESPPSLVTPTATFAGAPPGAFLNAGASASDNPPTVGTKSMSNSPKHTINSPFLPIAQVSKIQENQDHEKTNFHFKCIEPSST